MKQIGCFLGILAALFIVCVLFVKCNGDERYYSDDYIEGYNAGYEAGAFDTNDDLKLYLSGYNDDEKLDALETWFESILYTDHIEERLMKENKVSD